MSSPAENPAPTGTDTNNTHSASQVQPSTEQDAQQTLTLYWIPEDHDGEYCYEVTLLSDATVAASSPQIAPLNLQTVSHQPELQQTETEVLVVPSSTETALVNAETPTKNPTDTAPPPPPVRPWAQDLLSLSLIDRVSERYPATETSPQLNADDPTGTTSTLLGGSVQESAATLLSKTEEQPILSAEPNTSPTGVQDLLPSFDTLKFMSQSVPIFKGEALPSYSSQPTTSLQINVNDSLNSSTGSDVDGNKKARGSESTQGQYICGIPGCGKVFSRSSYLERHTKSHNAKKNFACPHCDKKFARRDSVRRHVKLHLQGKQIVPKSKGDGGGRVLQSSNVSSTSSRTLYVQVVNAEPSSKAINTSGQSTFDHSLYTMQTSANSSRKSQSLVQVPLPASPLTPLVKEVSNVQGMLTLEAKKPERREQTKCQCPLCSAEGGNKIKGPSGKHLHICHVAECGKVFEEAELLIRHLECHDGNRHFLCPLCNKVFFRQDKLKEHIRRHATEKRLGKINRADSQVAASIPPAATSVVPKVENKLENDKPKITCTIAGCGGLFSHIKSLNEHLVKKHGVDPYACTSCGERFRYWKDFQLHMKIHTGETILHCPYCNVRYASKYQLKKHVNLVHEKPKFASSGGKE